ncbi:DNA-3-methyladenine glycosylase 2 family protein [Arthrobacter sp. Sa2CUA1]|uniref:DNA-3-methyladenine glycosylase II n=1 Tax=Arthrobacter gallicola TaxID=2762225 RepID=A0ABR8UQF1_9MICC|nr:DNA-3-methyladenine glycosylase 2 family protein [Arthrobacter gallicola]MBD7994764.1 DNA-3-methyladenine glycosylase 2 family protein [Arthrobacter gallicola]
MSNPEVCVPGIPATQAVQTAGRTHLLEAGGPFPWQPLVRSLAAHAVPGLESVEGTAAGAALTRLLPSPDGPVLARVEFSSADGLTVRFDGGTPAGDAARLALVRRWLDLDADTPAVDGFLAGFPRLAPLVARHPGLRIPGAVNPFETAVLTVLGQQVSLAAARTFGARLVSEYGTPGPGGFRLFPSASALAEVPAGELQTALRITGARSRTIHTLSVAVAGGLDVGNGGQRAALLALPGIGPWTADYLAVRAGGDRDAFVPGDLILRRALGVATAREAEGLAEPWRPWRAYALFHLWTDHAYDGAPLPAQAGA